MNAIVPVTQQFNVTDMERIARAFAASKLFGAQNPEQALALCLVAQSEGRHPASAAQDYNIIQGRPAKKADAMLRDFIANGGKVEWHALTDEKADATFTHPYGGSVRIDWTLKRAQAAGINNPMWKKYPRQMLRSRTVSEGVRTVCPGATSGMYVPEEVQDIVHEQPMRDVTPQEALPPPSEPIAGETTITPKRLSAAEAKRQDLHTKFLEKLHSFTDVEALDEWAAQWDVLTETWPLSWLEPMNDKYLMHREALIEAADFPGDRPATLGTGPADHMEGAGAPQ